MWASLHWTVLQCVLCRTLWAVGAVLGCRVAADLNALSDAMHNSAWHCVLSAGGMCVRVCVRNLLPGTVWCVQVRDRILVQPQGAAPAARHPGQWHGLQGWGCCRCPAQ